MNDFVIYTDSACDIPPELLKEWGVPYSWLTYVFDGDARQYSNYELPFPEFYDKMRKGSVARTSAVNADAFVQGFEPILQDGVAVHGARARDAALAHLVRRTRGRGRFSRASPAVEHVGQPGVRYAPLQKLRRDVACGIGVDHKVVHGILSLYIQQNIYTIISIGRSGPRKNSAGGRGLSTSRS